MVNLDLYRIFYTVARCGSLTKAAEELYISQPAVSQSIKQLETQLGTPLFKRTHRGMELSAQGGEVIINNVAKALDLLKDAEDKLAELRGTPSGTLRIGASESIFQYILSEKIVEYHRMYPQVKIELIEDITPNIIDTLKNDRCDVGFVTLPTSLEPELELIESIMLLHDVFVAGRQFENLKGKELSVWDLQNYPLIFLDTTTVSRASIIHFSESMGMELAPAIEVDSWGFMKQLVERGMGIGCIPREYTQRRLREGTLFELNVSPALPSRSVGMAVLKDVAQPFALRLFIKMFESPEKK